METQPEKIIFYSSLDVFEYLKPLIAAEAKQLWLIALGDELEVTACQTQPSLKDQFRPREVLGFVCKNKARHLLLAQTDPSRALKPSFQDFLMVKRVFDLCQALETPLLDFLILCREDCRSFRDQEWSAFKQAGGFDA